MRIFKFFIGLIGFGVVGYLGFVAFIVFSPDIENYRNRTEFSSELWKNWQETETTSSLRWDMTHSLTQNYELIGKSTDEIIELLGTPLRQSNRNMSYYLGMSRHGIDTGTLTLKLENDMVLSYDILHG